MYPSRDSGPNTGVCRPPRSSLQPRAGLHMWRPHAGRADTAGHCVEDVSLAF